MSLGTATKPKSSGRRSAARKPEVHTSAQRKFLPEVQGLRALAVLMVVSYHVWFGRISGGVDIFLLVSAFLLTGQFTRKLEAGRPLELLKYWAHLFKRLLPLIAVTLLATLGATYLFVPQTRWNGIFGEAWASLFYLQNWFLASKSVDYYATDHSVASPLQHFWSLSIQGQIFILWPLIFALALIIARRYELKIRPLLIYMFGAVFSVSLVFSIVTTHSNQEFAYFDTRTRLWEFALGSLLALVLPYLRFKRPTRIVLGWLGIIGMLSCGLVLQVGQQFPGYMALWPTLSAAFIIVAGSTESPFGADRFLSWKPLVKLGDSSYALYLVHWPLLVIFLVVAKTDQAGPLSGLGIIVVSVAAAWALTKWVDTPLRRTEWLGQNKRRALIVVAVCFTLVAVPLGSWQVHLNSVNHALMAQAERNNPGAASLFPGYVDRSDPGAALLPTLATIDDEWPHYPIPCVQNTEEDTSRCTNGNISGTKSIVALGSSHSYVLSTPVIEIAAKNNWQLSTITKGGCPLGDDPSDGISEGCIEFNKSVLEEVLAMKPDLVLTSSTRTDARPGYVERLDSGWVREVQKLNEAGIEVLAVRDTPRTLTPVPQCMEESPADYTGCGALRDEIYPEISPTDAVAPSLPGTKFLDFSSFFCPDTSCPAVIGNVIVYKDDNHVTRTFMETLTPIFEREFREATGWLLK
ncbi:acyltransferase family protein [Arthrobacter sp. GMC3]|uniref:acyltransferase family protein n=1 Tax=Arthrobacter sp. GMC3 TaxID=2058894 RepID=UPI000CE3C2EC|nr:acyltransferase family protein [Arthrobacter sp. GMC3]